MKHNKIERLIYLFSKLPGIGNRTAKRVVLHLIRNRDRVMMPIAESLLDAERSIKECKVCNNIDEGEICSICTSSSRDKTILCVVGSIVDLWALENAKFFQGLYHVLGGTLSSTHNRNPDDINIDKLIQRISHEKIQEVIIATNATIEGQTTALFITEKLKPLNVHITRFANGIPVGGEFDYLDEMTISAAFNLRKPI
jgi:recombination protein RecR